MLKYKIPQVFTLTQRKQKEPQIQIVDTQLNDERQAAFLSTTCLTVVIPLLLCFLLADSQLYIFCCLNSIFALEFE